MVKLVRMVKYEAFSQSQAVNRLTFVVKKYYLQITRKLAELIRAAGVGTVSKFRVGYNLVPQRMASNKYMYTEISLLDFSCRLTPSEEVTHQFYK